MTQELCLCISKCGIKAATNYNTEVQSSSFVSVYLDMGNALLWLQPSDVILELDDYFDQVHYAVIYFVICAVKLSCGRRLKKE